MMTVFIWTDKITTPCLWQDMVQEEMFKVWVTFQTLAVGESIPLAYQIIRYHIVYDMKIENFRWKAWFVAGGNMTKAPTTITYASVVSNESVWTALPQISINCPDPHSFEWSWSEDCQHWECIPHCSSQQKNLVFSWTQVWLQCWEPTIVVHSLYGLKSTGATFCNHLANCMCHLGCNLVWLPKSFGYNLKPNPKMATSTMPMPSYSMLMTF